MVISDQSSLAIPEAPHITRLKGIMNLLTRVVQESNDSQYSRMGFLLSIASSELCDELGEMDEMQVRLYLYQMGEVISWVGHGDNSRLPEQLREFADIIQPQAGNETSTAISTDS